MLQVGDTYEKEFSFSQDQVNLFAEITGDSNPIHLDEEFAATSVYGRRIIHGMLGSTIFSTVFGMEFPGNGAVYRKQELKFSKPMFVDISYVAKFEVTQVNERVRLAVIRTKVIDKETSKVLIDGEANIICAS